MINSKLVKSMRELKGWKQCDLAEKTSLSLGAIQKLEKDINKSSAGTINSIEFAFMKQGITFTQDGDYGVIRFPLDKGDNSG